MKILNTVSMNPSGWFEEYNGAHLREWLPDTQFSYMLSFRRLIYKEYILKERIEHGWDVQFLHPWRAFGESREEYEIFKGVALTSVWKNYEKAG
jgi:hypothetical protein